MTELDFRVPNPDELLEVMLLGAMMHWPDVVDDYPVDVQWFDDELNRRVCSKILQTVFDGGDGSPVSVALHEPQPFVLRVYQAYDQAFTSKVSFDYYLNKLKECWARRVLTLFGQNLLGDDIDVREKVNEANRILDKLADVRDDVPVLNPKDYLDDYVLEMGEGDAFMPTSWRRLNKLIGGWRDSGLYVIGGRPGAGKTIVLLQSAWDLAKSGKKVLFVSLEMPVKQLQHRILAQSLGLDVTDIADDNLDYEVMHADGSTVWARDMVKNGHQVLNDNLLMVAPVEITPAGLRQMIKRQLRAGDLDAVFVDYLQITDDDAKHTDRSNMVRAVSSKFKKIAKQFDFPLITAVQLNRDVESRVKGKPRLTDISESDKIGMDADVAVMIHRDFREGDNPDGQGSDLFLLVVKNRHGQTGAARFVAQDSFSRIVEQ